MRPAPAELEVHPDGTFSLEESDDMGNTVFGGYGKQHVDVIRHCMAFQDFPFFLFDQFGDELADLLTFLSEQDLFAVFGSDDHVVAAMPFGMALGVVLTDVHKYGVKENYPLSGLSSYPL